MSESKGGKRQKLSTLDFRLSTLHFGKIIFWNHRLPGFARIIEEMQGFAWASQAGAVLSNPFASELARDSEIPSPILLRKWPCDASPWNFRGKKPGCAWPAKRENVLKKHPQARLRVSFIKQIWHSRSESTRCFLSFLSVYILVIRGLKFLAAKRRENAKNDGLTVVKTFYTFHTCLQQQL
jgi:hypothetical protein